MTELPAAETLAEMLEDTEMYRVSVDLAPAEMARLNAMQVAEHRLTGVMPSKRAILVGRLYEPLATEQETRRRGAPSKLTPHVRQTILDALKLGATRKDAAQSVGVSYETVRSWFRNNTQFSAEAQKIEIALRVKRVKRLQRKPKEGSA